MKRPSRRASALGAAALAMAGSLTLAACSERSPEQSTMPYDPSDGVVANLGSLAVRNLLVVSAGQGQPGVVSGALVNSGTGDLTVTFSTSGGAAPPVTVPAGQVVRLGSGEGASNVQFQAVSSPPGSLLAVRVTLHEFLQFCWHNPFGKSSCL